MLKNISWVFVSKCISMGAFFIADMFIARRLGKTQYGEWAFFYSIITAAFYFCWFGLNQSSKVYVSKEKSFVRQKDVVNTSLICRILFSSLFSLIVLLLAEPLSMTFGYPNKYPNLYALLIVGSAIVFGNSIAEYSKQLFMGLSDFKSFFFCNTIEFALLMFSVIIALTMNNDIVNVAKGYAVSYAITSCITIFYLLRKYQKLHVDFQLAFQIFKYALPLALLSLGGLLMVEMDTFMLGFISTNEQVAVYSIAKSLTSKASQVNYSITCGTIQEFSNITAENCSAKKAAFNKVVKFNLIVTSLICLAFVIFSPLAIKMIYGDEYSDVALVIWMLIPYYFLLSISNLYSNFLDFQKKANIRLWCYVITIAMNFVLNFCLIPRYGAHGAAIASGIALIPYTVLLILLSYHIFSCLKQDSK